MLTDEQRNELKTLIVEYGIAAVMEGSENRRRQINRIVNFVDDITASAAPAEVDNWQQYAKEGETAQECIERHRAEQDALLKLYGRAALAEGRKTLREMADVLFAAWAKAEPTHSITQFPESYKATFMDMARAVLATAPTISEAAVLRAERDHARDISARSIAILSRIRSFLTPEDVRLPDGRVMQFNNPEIEREMLRGLCAAIRAIPGDLAIAPTMSEAARVSEGANHAFMKAVEAALKAWITEHYACSRERMMSVLDAWYAREDALRPAELERIDRAAAREGERDE